MGSEEEYIELLCDEHPGRLLVPRAGICSCRPAAEEPRRESSLVPESALGPSYAAFLPAMVTSAWKWGRGGWASGLEGSP